MQSKKQVLLHEAIRDKWVSVRHKFRPETFTAILPTVNHKISRWIVTPQNGIKVTGGQEEVLISMPLEIGGNKRVYFKVDLEHFLNNFDFIPLK